MMRPRFSSLKSKLLAFALPSSLLPLIAMSSFTYYYTSQRVTQDRTSLFLEQLAQDTADKILLTLEEQRQSTIDMATNPWIIEALERKMGEMQAPQFEAFLNKEIFIHDRYDVALVLDPNGRILLTNSMDADGRPISPEKLRRFVGRRIQEFPGEAPWFDKASKGTASFREETQAKLLHTEKMASMGRLISGLAHEINNPLNFIYGNTSFLRTYVAQLESMIGALERQVGAASGQTEEVDRMKQEVGYDFMVKDIHTLLDNFDEGARRIHSIVSDIRTFGGGEGVSLRPANINALLDDTIQQVGDELGGRIRFHRSYASLPMSGCYAEKLERAFFHVLSNAVKAIKGEGNIWIETAVEEGGVAIRIRDDGVGMPEEGLKKIFDPFYTTRGVGQGAGLGLTVCYGVVEQHWGKVKVTSRPGGGTSVSISIPLNVQID